MKRLASLQRLGVLAGLMLTGMFGPQNTFAQHYAVGSEGIMSGSMPPPGFYIKDYNFLCWADDFPQGPTDFHATTYVNAILPAWITKAKILGADYGLYGVIPFGYQSVTIGGVGKDNTFGLGDMYFQPLLLIWHTKSFDFMLGDGWWAPTGGYHSIRLANLGYGYWANMIDLGVTWYPVADRSWAVSLRHHYEINLENPDTRVTMGNTYSLEYGISRTVTQKLQLGLVGYYQQQTTDNRGPGATDAHARRLALGPEVSVTLPKGFFLSLRYEQEFAVKNLPEGGTACFSITKAF